MENNLSSGAIAPVRLPYLSADGTESSSYSIDKIRNKAKPYDLVPVILGKHRVVPPLGSCAYS